MDATDPNDNPPSRAAVWGWLVFAGVAAATLLWIVFSSQRGTSVRIDGPGVGQKLTSLRLQPLTGDAQVISLADLGGRVTLLNFWGTWCPPCVQEFPHLRALAKDFGGHKDFLFLPVSCGSSDEQFDALRAETESFLEARRVEMAVYADQNADSRRALAMLFAPEQFAYPTTVILDSDGRIRGSWISYSPRYVDQMRDVVEALLAESAD